MPSPRSKSKGSKSKEKKRESQKSKKVKSKGTKKFSGKVEELEKLLFGRHRYDLMDSVFVKKSKNMVMYLEKIHIKEVWNRLPNEKPNSDLTIEGDSTSSKSMKSSKSKKSQKSVNSLKSGKISPKSQKAEIALPELEIPYLIGAVAVPRELNTSDDIIWVEVVANFLYYGEGKVPTYPEKIVSKFQCYRDFYYIHPYNFERPCKEMLEFTHSMLLKVKTELPGWRLYPFKFDLTNKPDSIMFNRPFQLDYLSGLFWNVRAYITSHEYCIPKPDKEVQMDFYKSTLTPVIRPSIHRPILIQKYDRFACIEDDGNLILSIKLDRDVYYQGEDIKVSISISNDSNRQIVWRVAAFVEQRYRFVYQISQDNSIPLGEVILNSGTAGLPIMPKKGWKTHLTLRPLYDETKYNLAVEGRMERDHKIFLAGSTIAIASEMVKMEELAETKVKEKSSNDSKKKLPKISKGVSRKSPKNVPESEQASVIYSKQSPKSKKGSSKKGKRSPKSKKTSPSLEKPLEAQEEPTPIHEKEVKMLTDNQKCRNVFISYEVVVSANIRTQAGDEGGIPMARVPFILSHETQFRDKLPIREPPIWVNSQMH